MTELNEKLQKVLAAEGLGSRREMERLIEAGQVKVNGKVAILGARVEAGDTIVIDKRKFTVPTLEAREIRVLLYNKPEGEICSQKDPEGRPSVFDRLPKLKAGRWVSVGRLDFNTSGLLLFTDSGELANRLMHPSSNIDREYLVRVQGSVTDDTIERLKEGVLLYDGVARFSDITPGGPSGGRMKSGLRTEAKGSNSWFYCTVMEGRNREVRRLWESQELRVSRLKRVRYGPIFIPSIVRQGHWLELEDKDIALLCKTVGLAPPPRRAVTQSQTEKRARKIRRMRRQGARDRTKSSTS